MGVFLYYLLVFFGIFSFSFVFWRKLREDYTPDQIFSATLLFLVGGFLGTVIFNKWLPQFSFWGFIVGTFLFGFYSLKNFGMKFFEALDGITVGLSWFSIFALGAIVIRDSWGDRFVNLIGVLPGVVTLLVYTFFLKKYRRFSWYPSGKIGFVGMSTVVVYFTLRALVATYQFWVLSSPGHLVDGLIALLVSLFFVGFIYFRSGRIGFTGLVGVFARLKRARRKNL